MIGVELMAKAVERQGVKTVFGIPGHLEGFFGALVRQNIRLINMRNEAAVVTAADGYARSKRSVGIACVAAGAGLANALGGLITAFEACTPLVLITGRNDLHLADTGYHQDLDHTKAVLTMTKWAATVFDPSRLGEYIDTACRIALSGRPGPVLLEVPRDVAQASVDDEVAQEALRPLVRPHKSIADPRDVERAVQSLLSAEKPIILAGGGAYWGDAGPGLQRLASEFRIPVLTRVMARGLVDEDMVVGFPWYIGFPAAQEADLVVFAGTRMRSSVGFASPPFFRQDARFIQVDIEASEIGRNRYVEAPVVGDCGLALEAIADELARVNYRPRDPGWVKKLINKKLERIDETGRNETGMPHPLQVARELAKRMPQNAIFIGDGANVLESFRSILRLYQAPGWMDHQPFGSMGVGLPLGIGVVAAQQETGEGRPVFVCTGDGSLGMYLAELATASLHELPMLIMVGNDGGWGASRNVTLRLFNGSSGCDMRQSRYDLVAEGLDCHGEFVPSVTGLAQAFDAAFAAMKNGKTVLMNYLIDRPTATSRGSDPLLNSMPYSRAPGLQGARKVANRD